MKRLRELRENMKLSQKEVANILGISRQAYNRYELDQRSPDNTMLIELATFFNVSVDYLLEKTELKKPINQLIKDTSKSQYPKLTKEENLQDEYLKLAYELQESDIDPNDIRIFVNLLKKQRK